MDLVKEGESITIHTHDEYTFKILVYVACVELKFLQKEENAIIFVGHINFQVH